MNTPFIRSYGDQTPHIHTSCFLAHDVNIIGDVVLADGANIWYGAVLRGDVGPIRVGRNTNIQDQCMLHCTTDRSSCIVKDHVTVGHRAILHGCTVEEHALIGMGAIVLDDAVVGAGAIVAAGSVVLEHTIIPSDTLWAGVPARQMKELDGDTSRTFLHESAVHYVQSADRHADIQTDRSRPR